MSKITELFEKEVVNKIQAKNAMDKKYERSRLGFNRGVSYLENLCEQLQKHIPSLGCELVEPSKSGGHFVFDANGVRITIQLWGRYNSDGGIRMGFGSSDQEFALCYKNVYWRGGDEFEAELVKDMVERMKIVQMG